MLPVCLGRATKVCDLLTEKDKTYRAVLLLGRTTDTQDITGEILGETDTDFLKAEEVEKAVLGFVGEYSQIPPMYSALKVNGRKLYELAREGKKCRTEGENRLHPGNSHSENRSPPGRDGSNLLERNLYPYAVS